MSQFEYPVYDAVIPEAAATGQTDDIQVVIVGAGPVGLTAALDLAAHDVPVVVLDDDNTVSTGSRAICWSKRTLEIFSRLDCAAPLMQKGVTWQRGRVFDRDEEIYSFDLLPEPDHQFPAFINLQQYYVEQELIEKALSSELIDLRWNNRVVDVRQSDDGVLLDVETPDGPYRAHARYVIAADGARSTVRKALGLDFVGRVFEDRFLIADVKMKAGFPTERWFWFRPPFHPGPSTLLHKQADNVWRIDFQLGPDVDAEAEAKPENVVPRLKAMLGDETEFDLEWVSVYRFQARRLDRFVHGDVMFIGDCAHQVSPFGARGGNSGIQDADNLVWKLALVLSGKAPANLLESFDDERVYAAIENLTITSSTTDFMSAKGEVQTAFRDAALTLAKDYPFAQRFVNAGRLSTPTVHARSPLNTADRDEFSENLCPGTACVDAPIAVGGAAGWLVDYLGGGFAGLYAPRSKSELEPAELEALNRLNRGDIPVRPLIVADCSVDAMTSISDTKGRVAERYDLRPGTFYLIRPDQYVAGRWRSLDEDTVFHALDKAVARVNDPERKNVD
ncbi:MAG: FAD-dependent oxidoreductase [Alphaproteobacteria bacterium]|nr:FAD-dependent oxidoreductase [Alphaproteobacteria bacterium]